MARSNGPIKFKLPLMIPIKYINKLLLLIFLLFAVSAQSQNSLMRTVLNIYKNIPCSIATRDMKCIPVIAAIRDSFSVQQFYPASSTSGFDRVNLNFFTCSPVDSENLDTKQSLAPYYMKKQKSGENFIQSLLISPRYFCGNRSIIIVEFKESIWQKWRTIFYCENEKIVKMENIRISN